MGRSTVLRPKKTVRVTREAVVGRPLFGAGTLYVLGDTELVGLAEQTYDELWRTKVRSILASHTTYKDAVIVTRGITPAGDVVLESADTMVAIDHSGAVVWALADLPSGSRADGNGVLAPYGNSFLIIDGSSGDRIGIPLPVEADSNFGVGRVGRLAIVRSTDGTFCGVDVQRREVVWARALGVELAPQLGASPRLRWFGGEGDVLIAYGSKHLVAVDAATGAIRWTRPVWIQWGMPAIHDGRVYLWPWTAERPCRVQASTVETGETVFDVNLASLGEDFTRAREGHTPVLIRNTVVYTTRQGVIVMVRISDGSPLAWAKYTSGLNAPAAVAGDVIVTSESGRLMVYDVPE